MKKSNQFRAFIYLLLFVVLVAAFVITQKVRNDADRQLSVEAAVTADRNKQIESEKQSIKDYEKWKRENTSQP